MDDKVKAWRSSRLHRKCIFCKYLEFHAKCIWKESYEYYKCAAKDRIILDLIPNFTKTPRPFCKLFELKVEEE